jgi:putative ABC transport system permease protein
VESIKGSIVVVEMKNIKPPRLADRLFLWFCDVASVEDLHGDVEELFNSDLQRYSVKRAKLAYWQRIISLMFSYAIKKRKKNASIHQYSKTSFNFSMLKNYFLIATRSLAKHKLFTFINVFGLAVGMSISLLVIAMISFLVTYDNFHVNNDRVYRILSHVKDNNRNPSFASTPAGLAEKLTDEYSGTQQVIRINSTLGGTVVFEQKEIPLNGYFVDPKFLSVFSFPLIAGNVATALDKPNTLLISSSSAEKLFGKGDALGKLIEITGQGIFEITGILKDVPKNSHMQFEMLSSYRTLENIERNNPPVLDPWKEFYNSYIYMLLPENGDPHAIEEFLNKSAASIYRDEKAYTASFELQPMNDIVPGRDLYNEIGTDWGYSGLLIFIGLTLLILLPACFNYANISISRALKRMKEIGVRKVMGGQRSQIFFQFTMETVIITFIALGLAYYLFVLVRPEFIDMIVGGSTTLDLSLTWQTAVYFILFALLVGMIAGIVPALYFSKLNPIEALKAKPAPRNGLSKFTLRKTLIVLQFTLSLGFIMSVVIVLNQYGYAMNYDFGFNQENILDVRLQSTDPQIFKNEFSKLSPVQSMSMSAHIIGTESMGREMVSNVTKTDSVEAFENSIDENFIENLNLKLLAGRNFSSDEANNKKFIIVNEEFVKDFDFNSPSEALDQQIILNDGREVVIGGVVKNFHYMSLREPIRSFFFQYDPTQFKYANLRIISTDAYRDISQMEAVWKTLGSEKKFESRFFNDEMDEAYSFYFSMVKICGFLGLLAITISCLGLLGMVVFTVENRLKEVGIRKVMGASSSSVTLLLSKDFLKLMIIAAAIAIPCTYLFFEKMYLDMAQYYRSKIGAAEIAISLFIMLLLGLTTILSQTAKAARANPVDTLRYE